MATKIQINSLPALMHLLEADGDIGIEIRRSVLKEYETKHVLPTVVARIDEVVTAHVQDLLFANKKKWGYKTKLAPEYRKVLKTLVEQQAETLVRDLVTEAVEKAVKPFELEERASRLIYDQTFYEVQKQVKAKIAEALG